MHRCFKLFQTTIMLNLLKNTCTYSRSILFIQLLRKLILWKYAMQKALKTIMEEPSLNGIILESIATNAHKFYTTAPVHDGKTQPFEIIERSLRDAYSINTDAKEISEALFVNSFHKQMVRS